GSGPPTGSGPPIVLPTTQAQVQANKVLIDLTCALAGPCPGRVRLQNLPAPGATILPAALEPGATAVEPAAKARRIPYAGARFKRAGGQTQTIAAKLKPAGRKLVHAPTGGTIWANVTFTGSKPPAVVSEQITLGP